MVHAYSSTKPKCSFGSLNTMYLGETSGADDNDAYLALLCAGSIAAPKQALTKAQKNRTALEKYNAGLVTNNARSTKGSRTPPTRSVSSTSTPKSFTVPPRSKAKSLVIKPTTSTGTNSNKKGDVEPQDVPKTKTCSSSPRRSAPRRSKSMINRSAASMQTMYLGEMNTNHNAAAGTADDTYLVLQCATSVAAPQKALTKAQKNKLAIDAYNAKCAAAARN